MKNSCGFSRASIEVFAEHFGELMFGQALLMVVIKFVVCGSGGVCAP